MYTGVGGFHLWRPHWGVPSKADIVRYLVREVAGICGQGGRGSIVWHFCRRPIWKPPYQSGQSDRIVSTRLRDYLSQIIRCQIRIRLPFYVNCTNWIIQNFAEPRANPVVHPLLLAMHARSLVHLWNSLHICSMETSKLVQNKTSSAESGISIYVAIILFSGQMAGTGLLKLPYSMVGTGSNS